MTRVSELLSQDNVLLDLKSREKVAAIHELAQPLISDGAVTDEDEFFAAVLRRENLESTGIGQGIAIPHARTRAVSKTAVAVGRAEHGVDFNSLDGNPSHIIFLIASPEDRKTEYIMTLARVSKLLRKEAVRIGINRAQSAEEVLELIAQHE